ncbi:outer membrane protein OmpA-like peptidoglycan-associated protein [Acidovorax sp. 62]|uniref:OmpA family protein n=1 Tax=Acidovorax sp. 62 TaxID=2035203 RepID=UPI000C180EA1|nr:OmpA family protein [Acidovorax sp. 62]PIF92520.1 outer membrane protein OmpA-like peptidoglycan-associated protein [Acidovorax sp. 62]
MRKHILLGVSAVVILATGCASMDDTQRRTATGAGIGALAGAVIGSATGGNAGTGAVVGAGVGALGTYIWSQNMERQKREMEQATQGTGIAVTQTADNQLMLNVPSDISFAVGRSDIQPNFAPVLDQFAAGLRNNPYSDVRIVGHTDSTGSDAVNNPLSVDRAASTRSYLVARGVDGRRIAIDGVGERHPIASNDTADGRARNRRVEIFVGERPR